MTDQRTVASRRGFTLTNMVFVIMILGVFALLAGEVINAVFKSMRQSAQQQDRRIVLDRMILSLRADVWGARAMSARRAGELRLEMADGATVLWQADQEQGVQRNPGASAREGRQTYSAGLKVEFEPRPGGVLVRIEDAQLKQSEEIVLASQVMLAGGSR
jgi:type II secretory pathway component PulJ